MVRSCFLGPIVALICAVSATAQPAHVRGIPKKDLHLYASADGKFTCFDKSATIPLNRVNDDFCDCADGSDEPGTSACPNSKFYCKNTGAASKYIHSYAVNDGVCDCCDGTDEYTRGAVCPDVCKAEGAERRKTLEERLRAAETGAGKRAEYEAQGLEAANKRKTRLVEAEKELQAAKTTRELAEASVAEAETAEKVELEARKAAAGTGQQSVAAALKLDTLSKEQLVDLVIAHAKETKTTNELLTRMRTLAGDQTLEWPAEEQVITEYKSEAGNAARDALATARTAELRLETEVKDLKNEDSTDYGEKGIFYALKGRCFDLKVNQYNYQACPFGSAKQDFTNLGSFAGWGTFADGSKNYNEMAFTGGQTCWNGPSRSLKLLFECGDTDALLTVDEPEKCTYTARFRTPAACKESLIGEIRAALAEDDGHVRDEL